MPSDSILLPASIIRQAMHDIFDRMDVPHEERRVIVETLMEASLSGYHSHGIMRVSTYVDGIRLGTMKPGAPLTVLKDTPVTRHLDANFGMGPVTAAAAIQQATAKAASNGIGCVSVVHANDVARLGSYMQAPALAGYVSVLLVNDAGGNPAVAPWGGVEPFLSTNPLAAGIPWKDDCPIVIDISTSVAAAGKLKTLHAQNREAPAGWLIDRDGNPTTDVRAAPGLLPVHALLPLGGFVAGHKGFALSMLVDICAGALSGAGCSAGVVDDTERNGLFILVIDPDKFVGREVFKSLVEVYVDRLKRVKTMPGVEEILVPGERASRERIKRRREGIPIDRMIWGKVEAIMNELGIHMNPQ
ncbi:MAG: Ldh family oxidoreductase [Gemmatimonadota bacterium]|nr:Ldh family oxidoreductase [Gemmatimonadota bacterium]